MSHLVDSLLKLPAPMQGKPRIATILSAVTVQTDQLSRVFADVELKRDIDTADLKRLEDIGALIGEPSVFGDVEFYRKIIRARVLANNSDCSLSAVRGVHSALFGTGIGETFVQLAPKYLQIQQYRTSMPVLAGYDGQVLTKIFLRLLQDASDPGLHIEILYNYEYLFTGVNLLSGISVGLPLPEVVHL